MLPQIDHHEQEEHAQGNAERDHLAAALWVGDLHHPRVINVLGKVDLGRADEHAARLRGCRLPTPLNTLYHRWEKNSGCHHFLLPEGLTSLPMSGSNPRSTRAEFPGPSTYSHSSQLFPQLRAKTQVRSAARNLALRDRGLRSISSSSAVTGFLVSTRYTPSRAPSRNASFTMRSSSEWKLMTTSLPPGLSTCGAAPLLSSARRSSSSRFTRIRSAWKVRVAG